MNRLVLVLTMIAVFSGLPRFSMAQSWTPEKQEVWKAVERLWSRWSTGDVDFYADDFRGWNSSRHAPYTKAEIVPWVKKFHEKNDIVLYDLNPLAIDLHGDIAIAFYTYQILIESSDGSQREEIGHWTDIYRKVDGEWHFIAEMGQVISGGQ